MTQPTFRINDFIVEALLGVPSKINSAYCELVAIANAVQIAITQYDRPLLQGALVISETHQKLKSHHLCEGKSRPDYTKITEVPNDGNWQS